MRKVSKQELSKMAARGKTVTPLGKKVTTKKPTKTEQPVQMASMSAVIKKIQDDNKKVIKSFSDDVKKLMGRKRKPWKFTVKRNNQGTIISVLADPIE